MNKKSSDYRNWKAVVGNGSAKGTSCMADCCHYLRATDNGNATAIGDITVPAAGGRDRISTMKYG